MNTLFLNRSSLNNDVLNKIISATRNNKRKIFVRYLNTKICEFLPLPFGDDYFDAIIVMNGVMFSHDMNECVQEMRRVLKKGRKLFISEWAEPKKNPWMTFFTRTINKAIINNGLSLEITGFFRKTPQVILTDMFKKSGFKKFSEMEISRASDFENMEQFWELITSIASPKAEEWLNSDEFTQEKIKENTLKEIRDKFSPSGKISFPWTARVISAEK